LLKFKLGHYRIVRQREGRHFGARFSQALSSLSFLAPLNSALMALAAIAGGMISRKSTHCLREQPMPRSLLNRAGNSALKALCLT
jgi:hypothetical protein